MKKFLSLVLILFITIASFAQIDRSKKPAAGPAPEIKLGNYESFTLKNGLKVFVVENKKVPRVSFNLFFDIDPIVEGKHAGYVEATGELLRTGTKTRSKDKLDEEIDFLGATLNTSSNNIFASALKKQAPKLLEIMSDIVLNSDFKQEELDKIIKKTLSNLAAQKDEPNAISQRVRDVLNYGKDHPYGEPTTEETVKSINLDLCNNYYKTYLKPNIAYLSIVGDINKKEAQKLVEKYFGNWKAGDVPKTEFQNPKAPLINKVALVDRANAVQSVISVSYPIEFNLASEDYIKASVMNTILGGSFTSRINKNLRETKGFTYGAGSNLRADKFIGVWMASAPVRNIVTDSALTEIFNEMKRIRNEKVSDEELQINKNYMIGNFVRSLENPQTIANFAINIERYKLPKDFYKNYLKNLNDVTADDVLSVAKKYIKPNNANVLIVGKAEEVAKNLTKFSMNGKIDYYDIYGEKYDPNVKKAPEGLTAEQVIDKYIQVMGGKDKLSQMKDETMKLTGSMQGMNLVVTITRKAPNKLFQLIDFGVGQQKTVFDGTRGKVSAMGQEQELSGSQLEEMKVQAALNAFLDYASQGIKLELAGMEPINKKDAYKINLIYPSGKKNSQYYDAATGFLIRTNSTVDSPQGSLSITIDYDDYKELNGYMVAHKMIQGTPMGSIELTLSSYEVNKNVSDDLFKVE
ncbi:insulinase family protein [Stygiobacter electus]|uniref:Insulinase family protein n=1 Tax=Stygiobacter electus TaxID=3032292 RepID=A0AAE3NZT6_9BACT|nr:insulinase family protein [Stygiobacter electus]MDF1611630.1 insulinase family protein [Stygiobacter electus]